MVTDVELSPVIAGMIGVRRPRSFAAPTPDIVFRLAAVFAYRFFDTCVTPFC